MDAFRFIFSIKLPIRLMRANVFARSFSEGKSRKPESPTSLSGGSMNELPCRFISHPTKNGLRFVCTRVVLMESYPGFSLPVDPCAP
ncbi:hypothetical protein HNQ77_005292 [Silvibacterium bohemicum]|uniref:Uncharacterized protein n=1 Tax=Silvibacterium bohemicum TaxID=1577686 RepID=A0A841K165_9BACT|nr:hypothetical protein [Silvibacterium bohemicum]